MARSSHIGAYRILRLINQGGQGSVYLGFDDRLHRRVAIKIYQLPRERALRRSVLREAQIVAKIQSPKVVQIYDLVVANDHVALIMEYVPGCDLEEFLGNTLPSLPSILTICIDVAGALAVARQQKIVHGDLKASNILISSQGRAKLTDFGIARREESQTHTDSVAASLSCVSPEQYLGKPFDVRSDLFSLGCLLYRMLTGEHPFIRADELDVEALLEKDPPSVDRLLRGSLEVPPELISLMQAMLDKSPDNRPGNTHQVRDVLRKISREIPLSVGNTLLSESKSHFRPESPEDIPPHVPSDLTQNGRSSLEGNHALPRFMAGRYFGLWVLASMVCLGIVGNVLWQTLFPTQLRVMIEQPVFAIETEAELPPELSGAWMKGVIASVLHSQLGSVILVDPQGPKTFYSPAIVAANVKPWAQVKIRLVPRVHCVGQLCLLGLVIETAGEQFFAQRMIFVNMPISHWDDMVRSETLALLGQRG